MLNATGAACFKVGFNRGDQFFWSNAKTYIPFRDTIDEWPNRFETDGLPRPAPFYRLLSKVQGVFAFADPFWR